MLRLLIGLIAAGMLMLGIGLRAGRSSALQPMPSAARALEKASALPLQGSLEPERVTVLEPEAPRALDTSLPIRSTTSVHGTLFDSAAGPIEVRARVILVDQNGQRRSCSAEDSGTYAFSALEYGNYWVTVRAQGYRTLESKLELAPARPALGMDFTLEKAVQLRIRVVAAEGASGLGAVATRELPGERIESSVLGSLRNSAPTSAGFLGILQLDGDLPVFVSLVQNEVVLESVRVESAQDEVSFVLSPERQLARLAALRVVVLDAATRAPLAHAQLNESAETDAQGSATLAGCAPGECELRIRARGYETVRRSLHATAGVLTDLGVITLEHEVVLEGRVLDAAGTPRAAAFDLGIFAAPGLPIDWLASSGFESRGDGTFRVHGLGRRQYVIRTRSRDASEERAWKGASLVSPDVPIDLRAGDVHGLELRVLPAALLVLPAAREDAAPGSFRVVGEQGLEFAAGSLRGSQPRAIELPPGDYRVLLLDAQGALESERLVTLGAAPVLIQ
jgi:hypothetical protein